MKTILLGCALAISSATASYAVDYSTFNWSGFYAGVHGGYGWGKNDAFDSRLGPFPGTGYNFKPGGGFGGLQIGYNSQFATHWLIGGEIDSSWGDVSDDFFVSGIPTTGHNKFDYFGSARTRFGYVQDRSLFYITGGVAWARNNFTNAPLTTSLVRNYLVGGTIGAGWEYAFDQHWSFKAEYLYTDFNHNVDRDGINDNHFFDAKLNTVRVGLNYRFSDAASFAPSGNTMSRAGWNGGYLGVHGGYGWLNYRGNTNGGTIVDLDRGGGFGGFQSGANWQFAPNWLFGLETDASWMNIHDSIVIGGNTYSAKIEALGTARGRLGYIVDNMLFYGTAGGAYGREKSISIGQASEEDHFGWAAGGGIEWKFAPEWSTKIEYIHADLGQNRFNFNGGGTRTTDMQLDTVKVGLNYYGPVIERLFGRR